MPRIKKFVYPFGVPLINRLKPIELDKTVMNGFKVGQKVRFKGSAHFDPQDCIIAFFNRDYPVLYMPSLTKWEGVYGKQLLEVGWEDIICLE